jgi:hypothetical protein
MPPTSFSADRVSAGFTWRNALGAGVASDENASIQGVKSAAALPFFQKYTGVPYMRAILRAVFAVRRAPP